MSLIQCTVCGPVKYTKVFDLCTNQKTGGDNIGKSNPKCLLTGGRDREDTQVSVLNDD